jgi:hypothetical protein
MEVSGQLYSRAVLSLKKEPPNTRWVGLWIGSRARLGAVVKKRFLTPTLNRTSIPRSSILAFLKAGAADMEFAECKIIIFWDMTPCSPLSCTRRHIPEDDTSDPTIC